MVFFLSKKSETKNIKANEQSYWTNPTQHQGLNDIDIPAILSAKEGNH